MISIMIIIQTVLSNLIDGVGENGKYFLVVNAKFIILNSLYSKTLNIFKLRHACMCLPTM